MALVYLEPSLVSTQPCPRFVFLEVGTFELGIGQAFWVGATWPLSWRPSAFICHGGLWQGNELAPLAADEESGDSVAIFSYRDWIILSPHST